MKCRRCQDIISFLKPPFGAYFCTNEHAQCAECDLSSSFCFVCGEGTKYRSPHFVDQKTKHAERSEPAKSQIPLIRDILPAQEEESKFQKLRFEYVIDKPKPLFGIKIDHDLNTVRTLSAIVVKNLYTSNEENNKAAAVPKSSSHDFRLNRIIRVLRETRLRDELGAKEHERQPDSEKTNNSQTSKHSTNLLTPTHSKLEATDKKSISKINLKIETKTTPSEDEENECNSTFDKLANCKNFKSLFCPQLVKQNLEGFPISIEATSLDRRPFSCPLGSCGTQIFISELNNHIALDHPTMPLSRIKVGQFREFSIDVGSCENDFAPQGVVCFLLKKIVKNFGSVPLKDLLPIFLMIGRYNSNDGLDKQPKATSSNTAFVKPWSNKDFFVIWLAGVMPHQCEVTASISVFSPDHLTLSRWYVDRLNSIRSIQDVGSTFNACECLILTYPEIKLLTNDFKDMLKCQAGIIGCELKTLVESSQNV